MSFEEMPIIGRSCRYRKLRMGCRLSSAARLFADRASVGSRNEDFYPPVLGAPLGSPVVGNRRGIALAIGLQAVRVGQEGPEQGGNALGALDGQMVVVREADVAAADRRIVGVSDDFYRAFFLVERPRDTARERLELVEHGGRTRVEQDDIADPHSDLICGLLGHGVIGRDIRSEGGADALQLRNLVGFGWRGRWGRQRNAAQERQLADVVEVGELGGGGINVARKPVQQHEINAELYVFLNRQQPRSTLFPYTSLFRVFYT